MFCSGERVLKRMGSIGVVVSEKPARLRLVALLLIGIGDSAPAQVSRPPNTRVLCRLYRLYSVQICSVRSCSYLVFISSVAARLAAFVLAGHAEGAQTADVPASHLLSPQSSAN